jgi:hypothetical protein
VTNGVCLQQRVLVSVRAGFLLVLRVGLTEVAS